MTNLAGKWKYQSYRPEPGSVPAGPTAPTFVPWSPPGEVVVDACGTKGTLVFTGTPIKLDLKLEVADEAPARLSVAASMALPGGKRFTNQLQGWLVSSELGDTDTPLCVRGSIVQTSDDIAPANPQPKNTTGYFVLERDE